MSTTVTYKGGTLTTVDNDTKVLTTRGKYLEDNLTLVDETISPELAVPIAWDSTTNMYVPDCTFQEIADAFVAQRPITASMDGTDVQYGLTADGWYDWHGDGAFYYFVYDGASYNPSEMVRQKYEFTSQNGVRLLAEDSCIKPSGNKAITENGTGIDVAQYETVSVNVSGGGGGGEPAPKKQINFIDYDGTILHSYTKSEWQSVTALPSNPSHTGLTAQDWNWTKAQIDAQLTAAPDGDVWVGQMYVTTSGDTEIDVVMYEGRLSPTLTVAVNGTITVDWGDGTTANTVTGTSLTSRKAVAHTYTSGGNYTITIHVVSGSFTFYCSSTYNILRKNTSTNENRVYTTCIQSVRLGNGITGLGNYAFAYCGSLASITIPNSVTSMGTSTFSNCFSLASLILPNGLTGIGAEVCSTCYSLANISLPSGVTSIPNYSFQNCFTLASITIPSSVTSTGTSAFSNCQSLASVTIPSGVTSIGTSFGSCYGVAEYHIKPTSVPTLSSGAFASIPSDCVIYVPSASLETYKTASNWSTYASKMQGE